MKLKFQLYILSLWLLFLLLFINKVNIPIYIQKDYEFMGVCELLKNNIIPAISLLILLLGFIFYFRFKYIIGGNHALPEKISKIENVNWEHLTFLTTYVIPFVTFNFKEERNGLIFFLLLLIIGLIYIKTNMFYTNPTLALLGYHIYKISTNNRENVIIISKGTLKENDWIKSKLLSDNIYIANKSNNQ